MRAIFLFLTVLILRTNSGYSQKLTLYSENIYLEVGILEKKDSIAAEIMITNLSKEKVYFPVLEKFKIPQHELSCMAGILDIRVGVSSRFSGIPLEFTHALQQLIPNESVKFNTSYIKRDFFSKPVIAFDFITYKDLSTIFRFENVKTSPSIKGEDYASHIHLSRAESLYRNITSQ